MNILERYSKKIKDKKGICETCNNLIRIENCYACSKREKFIIESYPPFHGICKCDEWVSCDIVKER